MGLYRMATERNEISNDGESTKQSYEQLELITQREVLEAQEPAVLRAFITESYDKIYEIEKFIKLATEVYEGVTGEEFEG